MQQLAIFGTSPKETVTICAQKDIVSLIFNLKNLLIPAQYEKIT